MSLFNAGDRVISCTTQARGTVEKAYPRRDFRTQCYEVLWDGAGCVAFVDEKRLEPLETAPEVHSFASTMAEEVFRHAHDVPPAPLQDADTNPKDIIGATKPDLSLVPSALVIQVAEAMRNGAAKYGAYNWREKKVQVMTYLAAGMRHIYQYMDGEEYAEDSGVHHLAHAAACFGIVLDAIATGNLVDNRPTAGAASRLIADLTQGGK